MNLTVKEIVDILYNMRKNGVALYGCGINGKEALEMLSKAGIEVIKVADKDTGKECMGYQAEKMDKLFELNRETVCIFTIEKGAEEAKNQLIQYFTTVIDMQIIKWMKYFVPCGDEQIINDKCYPFNHYESPFISDMASVRAVDKKCIGINWNLERQLAMLEELSPYYYDFYHDAQNDTSVMRYNYNNIWYTIYDAALLSGMIRKFQPKRIIEIGSGYSTCVMLDTQERYLQEKVKITCVEPYPQRLKEVLKKEDNDYITIHEDFIQNIPLEKFEELEEGDILFIDSSHVAKVGGDIPYEYFLVLPRLKKGVLIHIHDLFYPFVYPEEWIKQGRPYNEALIVQALLMDSQKYDILFFNDMMMKEYKDKYRQLYNGNGQEVCSGGSLWLRKNG